MNERIAKLYDQAIVLEGNGDYVAGELDPEKFAELIIKETLEVARAGIEFGNGIEDAVEQYFGVKL